MQIQTFNIFPELFSFSLMAPVILRAVLGLIFLNLGYLKLTKEKPGWISSLNILGMRPASFLLFFLGVVEIIGAILILAGAYTQLAALVLAVITVSEALIEYKEESILKRDLPFYILIAAICISLILTGAGLFAIDIPIL